MCGFYFQFNYYTKCKKTVDNCILELYMQKLNISRNTLLKERESTQNKYHKFNIWIKYCFLLQAVVIFWEIVYRNIIDNPKRDGFPSTLDKLANANPENFTFC